MPSDKGEDAATMLSIGFMLAALGRQRICLLAAADQATSSVLDGVLRVAPEDTGVWRLLLAREMKRAGLDIDLNKAL
jgi:predicted nucleotide-binding protein